MKLEHVEKLAEALLPEKQRLWEQAEAEETDIVIHTDNQTYLTEGDITINNFGEVFYSGEISDTTIHILVEVDEEVSEDQEKTLAGVIAVTANALDIELDDEHVLFSEGFNTEAVMDEVEFILNCGLD